MAFLKGIPQDVLAKAALRSKAYTRALMHFEAYILENKENIQDHLTFLQVIKIGFVIIFLEVCQQKLLDNKSMVITLCVHSTVSPKKT